MLNRRGFFGLLGKAIAVGAALGVAPPLLRRAEIKLADVFRQNPVDQLPCLAAELLNVRNPLLDDLPFVAAGDPLPDEERKPLPS